MQYFTAFFKYKGRRILYIYSYLTHSFYVKQDKLRELDSHSSWYKGVMENKLLFEYLSNSSNSLENRSSNGLIAATEEVWIIDKHCPIYFHQQCLIKHSSHLFIHSYHPHSVSLLLETTRRPLFKGRLFSPLASETWQDKQLNKL